MVRGVSASMEVEAGVAWQRSFTLSSTLILQPERTRDETPTNIRNHFEPNRISHSCKRSPQKKRQRKTEKETLQGVGPRKNPWTWRIQCGGFRHWVFRKLGRV